MQQIHDSWTECFMRAAQNGNSNSVDIFLKGCGRDHLRCLPEPGIDDLHPGIAKRACDHFRSAVMSVESRLSDKDPDLSLTHIAKSILANKACKQTVGPDEGFQLC